MEKEYISARNLRCLLMLLILCGSLANGAFLVKQDMWIVVLLIGVIFLPLMLVYSRICGLFPGKGLFDIVGQVFGPKGRVIMILLLTLYTQSVTGLVLQNYTEFTVVISLYRTPYIPILILILTGALYLAGKGVKVLGRWSLVIFGLIVVELLLTLCFSMGAVIPEHILPVMDHPIGELGYNAYAIGVIVVGEGLMTAAVFGSVPKSEKPAKIFLPGILGGVLLFALMELQNIMVLGPNLAQTAQFPSYMASRVMGIGNFLERIESTISMSYLFLGVTKLSLMLMVTAMGMAQLFQEKDYRKFLPSAGVLTLALGTLSFRNVVEMNDYVWVYSYLVLPMVTVLPLVLWIACERKARKQKHEGQSAAGK